MSSNDASRSFTKGDFYRYCRLVHGWLSAFAFLVLCLFSATGLLLNHPEWLDGIEPRTSTETLTLDAKQLAEIDAAEDPGEALAHIAGSLTTVRGSYVSGERAGPEVFARLQGVRGLTDLRLRLSNGELEVVIESTPAMIVMNELHRAERAGNTWRMFVDVSAVVLIVLSIIGYLIFLSMRFRLRTALILTAVSAVGMWTLFSVVVY